MKLIYLHGLDSDHNALKGQMVYNYCQTHYPELEVIRPNLNLPLDDAIALIIGHLTADSVLMGSSLGGYFATLVSDMTATPCVLLNPSICPDVSFLRFLKDNFKNKVLNKDTIIYTTTGGWDIRYGDLAWLQQHPLIVKYPHKVAVLLKMGDELLDAYQTADFYTHKGAKVITEPGGDHRMTDFANNVGLVTDLAVNLLKNQNS